MTQYKIKLTEEEMAVLARIELDALALRDSAHAQRNGALVAELMDFLGARDSAIPSQRISWMTDPAYNIGGRGSSRKDVFERNGTKGNDILKHPHFLEYLRYFIHGPDLPPAVLVAFEEQIAACGPITSGDILPLAQFARQQVRVHHLKPRNAADEFFKLAVEHGMSTSSAAIIRKQVSAMR